MNAAGLLNEVVCKTHDDLFGFTAEDFSITAAL